MEFGGDFPETFISPVTCDGCRKQFAVPSAATAGIESVLLSSGIHVGPVKRCSRCQSAHYCSADCQKAHWPVHKAQCFDAALMADLDKVTAKTDIARYKDLATRERRIFRRLNQGIVGYEAMCYPHLFCMGTGMFDHEGPSLVRFSDYRYHLMHFFDGRFASDAIWSGWAKDMEKKIRSELGKEVAAESAAKKAAGKA